MERAADVGLTREQERSLADALVMTWEQVRALREAGMDVQSHTSTHRVLQTLAPRQLLAELSESRATLEAVLGEPVRAIAYPVGKSLRAVPDIARAVREAGYELGFSNGTGVNWIHAFDALDAKRLSMDRSMPDAFFRAVLAFPFLAY